MRFSSGLVRFSLCVIVVSLTAGGWLVPVAAQNLCDDGQGGSVNCDPINQYDDALPWGGGSTNITTEASSFRFEVLPAFFGPENLVDGDFVGDIVPNGGTDEDGNGFLSHTSSQNGYIWHTDYVPGGSGDMPEVEWVTFDFGGNETIASMRVWNRNDVTDFGIENMIIWSTTSASDVGAPSTGGASPGGSWQMVEQLDLLQAETGSNYDGETINFANPFNARKILFDVEKTFSTREIGLSEVMFFSQPLFIDPIRTWDTDGSGDWNDVSNWPGDGGIPDENREIAVFSAAITSPVAVFIKTTATSKRVELNNANTVSITGPGSLTLDADTGNTSIDVQSGNHEIEVDLALLADLDISTADGTSVEINDSIATGGNAINISGSGQTRINGLVSGGGTVSISGTLAAASSTILSGDLISSGILDIAAGGTIRVLGSASLEGTLSIDGAGHLLGGDLTVLTAAGGVTLTGDGLTLAGAAADQFAGLAVVGGTDLVLLAVPEPSTLLLILTAGLVALNLARTRFFGASSRGTITACVVAGVLVVGAPPRAEAQTLLNQYLAPLPNGSPSPRQPVDMSTNIETAASSLLQANSPFYGPHNLVDGNFLTEIDFDGGDGGFEGGELGPNGIFTHGTNPDTYMWASATMPDPASEWVSFTFTDGPHDFGSMRVWNTNEIVPSRPDEMEFDRGVTDMAVYYSNAQTRPNQPIDGTRTDIDFETVGWTFENNIDLDLGPSAAGYEGQLFSLSGFDARHILFDIKAGGDESTVAMAEVQFFTDAPPPPERTWMRNTSSRWNGPGNWSFGGPPDDNTETAIFAGAIAEPQAVFVETAATAKRVEFNHNIRYSISGPGTLTLEADTGNASIDVQAGDHEIKADLLLPGDLDISAASGTSLDINDSISTTNGNVLISVSGAGQTNINGPTNGGGSTISINNSGTLGTAGTTALSGDLTSTGMLHFDIAGIDPNTADSDFFDIAGMSDLSGSVQVDLLGEFGQGTEFTLLTAAGGITGLPTLTGASGSLSISGLSLILTLGPDVPDVLGDFNGDNMVTAADYVAYRNNLGTNNALPNDNGLGTPITEAHYALWKDNFGATAGSGSAVVPEPSTLVMLALTVFGFLCGRGGWAQKS